MRIFTTGYEDTPLQAFLQRLTAAKIAVVADVRELPLSRKQGFSKTALGAALAGRSIEYLHLRELGCPRDLRRRFRDDGDWSAYTREYLAHLAEQAPALQRLAQLALEKRTALLCYEADFERCHRTFVARAVARSTGARVAHLTAEHVVDDSAA